MFSLRRFIDLDTLATTIFKHMLLAPKLFMRERRNHRKLGKSAFNTPFNSRV
jgi:hypothetical protein